MHSLSQLSPLPIELAGRRLAGPVYSPRQEVVIFFCLTLKSLTTCTRLYSQTDTFVLGGSCFTPHASCSFFLYTHSKLITVNPLYS